MKTKKKKAYPMEPRPERIKYFLMEKIGGVAKYLETAFWEATNPDRPTKDEMIKEAIAALTETLETAQDPDVCLAECKMMYFCTLKKGHKGKHSTGAGLGWED